MTAYPAKVEPLTTAVSMGTYPVGFPTLRRTIQKIGKPWGKKGETPVVMTTGARYALSLISAITSKRPARRR